MVVARDRKHYADVKCEKHRFPHTLPMIFDRLNRHLGFSNLARLISPPPIEIIYNTRGGIEAKIWERANGGQI